MHCSNLPLRMATRFLTQRRVYSTARLLFKYRVNIRIRSSLASNASWFSLHGSIVQGHLRLHISLRVLALPHISQASSSMSIPQGTQSVPDAPEPSASAISATSVTSRFPSEVQGGTFNGESMSALECVVWSLTS